MKYHKWQYGKTVCSIVFLLLIGIMPAFGSQLHVPVTHGVYHVIQQLELKGAVGQLSGVKPYTEAYIEGILRTALSTQSGSYDLSQEEKRIIQGYLAEFSDKGNGNNTDEILNRGSIVTESQNGLLRTQVGAKASSHISLPVMSAVDYDLRNVLDFYLAADITDSVSLLMGAGLRLDKLDTQAYAPYRFSKPGEGFYFYFFGNVQNNIGYSDGEFIYVGEPAVQAPLTLPVLGFDMESDLVLALLDNAVQLSWGMFERDWGFGTNGLLLSGTARVFDAVEGRLQLADWLQYSYLTGTLTPDVLALGSDTDSFQNMVTMKRVEFLLPISLKLSIYESCVWVKRFELGYLNPFMLSMLYQNLLGDYDNMYAGVEFEYMQSGIGRIYGSLAFDELHHANPLTWLKEARDMFALQTGVELVLPWLPFASAQFQYTLISPFFYTHYPQDYPIFDDLINTNYINKGENLGYYLPPNSDELLLEISTRLSPETDVRMTIGWIRHSNQYGSSFDEYFEYAKYISGQYPEKDFSGNLVQNTLSAALYAAWDIPGMPISISGGYQWVMDSTRLEPEDPWVTQYQNIVSFGINVYY